MNIDIEYLKMKFKKIIDLEFVVNDNDRDRLLKKLVHCLRGKNARRMPNEQTSK